MISKDRFARSLRQRIVFAALLSVFISAFAYPVESRAKLLSGEIPSLDAFIETVKDGNAETLRGVFVANVMALPVVQQPEGRSIFVSSLPQVATQFTTASRYGNIGLLAHNTLAGASFASINYGDTVTIIYGDGRLESFSVETILQYEAFDPLSPTSLFRNLESEDILNASELIAATYGGGYHLTLQTCIQKNNSLSWGRLFILAIPMRL